MGVTGAAAGLALHIGMRFGGTGGVRYELVTPLGPGSFGTAWEAFDHDEHATVAVKLLHPTTMPDDVLREARLQRRLSEHPRIVTIRNVEIGANPSSFVVMDLIPGGSVNAVLGTRRPTVVEAQRWIRDVLEALDHAHQENVLHRDIKPSNLLLSAEGHALLSDFGVAEDTFRRTVPAPGMYALTLPPEFPPGPTTVQTDLWLVGLLAWQVLVGQRPDLSRARVGTLHAPHRESLEVPLALSRSIMPALAPDPAARPPSAQRMLEAIARVPIHCGWHDQVPSGPSTIRSWQADEAGGGVTVEVTRRPRGGYLVQGQAPAGSRLRSRRHAVEATEAAALRRARSWLTDVVAGRPL